MILILITTFVTVGHLYQQHHQHVPLPYHHPAHLGPGAQLAGGGGGAQVAAALLAGRAQHLAEGEDVNDVSSWEQR